MNIFAVDTDTMKCAKALDNLRLNKMIIETAQLLSTAMRVQGYIGDDIYKMSHINHPCAIWARASDSNYRWLLLYMNDLVVEKIIRTGKSHKSFDIFHALEKGIELMPKGLFTTWPNCTPNKHILDIHEAYRKTLIDKWINDKRPPSWGNAIKPEWA